MSAARANVANDFEKRRFCSVKDPCPQFAGNPTRRVSSRGSSTPVCPGERVHRYSPGSFQHEPIHKVLCEHGCGIAPSTYYAMKTRPRSVRSICDEIVLEYIT